MDNLSVVETLEKIYKLLEPRQNWIKGDFKLLVGFGDHEHYAFCLAGALRHIDGPNMLKAKQIFAVILLTDFGYTNITSFNDNPATKHEDVLDLITRAINKAKQ